MLNTNIKDHHQHADVYDISKLPLEVDSYRKIMDQVFVKSFIECMGSDDYMYALDWQHSNHTETDFDRT